MKKTQPKSSSSKLDVETDRRRGIQSVDIAIRILETLMQSRGALPLSLIAKQAGAAASTTHRYLISMQRGGLIRQNQQTGLYDLGPAALRLGSAAIRRVDAVEIAAQAAQKIVHATGETVFVSIWTEGGPLIVRWYHGHRMIITTAGVGSVLPIIASATGHIFAAYLPPQPTADLWGGDEAKVNSPFGSWSDFLRYLEQVRAVGYASIDGLIVLGLRAVAAPVFNLHGAMQAAVTILSKDRTLTALPNARLDALLAATREASVLSGYEPPSSS